MPAAVQVVIAVGVIAAVAAALWFIAWPQVRTQRLRRRFGSEYDHSMERHKDRGKAERELLDRVQRYREQDIRPLDPPARERYREQWIHVQEQFVDTPEATAGQAARLVTTVMAERGYPTEDFEERIALLSVEHARLVDHYRRGHEISTQDGHEDASIEDLRQAVLHYRALFEDLLDLPPEERAPAQRGKTRTAKPSTAHDRADAGAHPGQARTGKTAADEKGRTEDEGARLAEDSHSDSRST